MNLPCPICSSVIYDKENPKFDKPVFEHPMFTIATAASKKRKVDNWLWSGCRHAEAFDPKRGVETSERSLTEARWNVEARRLLEQRTEKWPAEQRDRFAAALGFRKLEVEA